MGVSAMKPEIAITERAAEKLAAWQAREQGVGVRLWLEPSGCSGYAYRLEVVQKPPADALAVEGQGFTLFVDREDYARGLAGLVIDYHEDLLARGFVYRNPNEVGRCGCGKSVALAEK